MSTFFGAFAGAVLISLIGRVLKGRALMGLAFICAVLVFVVFGLASLSPDMADALESPEAETVGKRGVGWIFGAMTAAATVVLASPFILLAERR